jgi:hypothetical protein
MLKNGYVSDMAVRVLLDVVLQGTPEDLGPEGTGYKKCLTNLDLMPPD